MRSLLHSALLLLIMLPGTSLAATLSISPSSGSYTVGDTVTVKVLVSSPDASINAVSGVVSISPSVFSIESISKSSSVLNFWPTEPSLSQSVGTVDFGGVAISGYRGPAAGTLSITLRAIHPGTGTVSFKDGQVLANDGNGTDITSGLSGASFVINTASPAPAMVKKENKVSTSTPPLTPGDLQPPIITSVTQSVAVGKVAEVTGSSVYPGAIARLTLQRVAGSPITAESAVGEDGAFSITLPHTGIPGDYSGSVVVEQNGVQSFPSASFVIRFEEKSLFDRLLDFLNQPGLLLAFAIIIAFLFGMYCARTLIKEARSEDSVRDVLHDVDAKVHKAFIKLRSSINTYLEELEKASARRTLSASEMRFVKKMTKSIKDTEEVIEEDVHSAGK